MSTSMIPDLGSLSFWRIADIPFQTWVTALDGWLRPRHGGELWFGASQLDRWSSSSTALELIPSRLVRPTAGYFQAGRLLLDSLTCSVSQYPEPRVTRPIAC